jgi:putative intracellular protease/amidase
MAEPRILIVTTSHSRMGDTGHATGLWAEELAAPYFAFREGGAEITIASIAGGDVPFDPRSLPLASGEGSGEDPEAAQEVPHSVERLLADEVARAATRGTPRVEDVAGEAFDAIFLPGGHGTMWDLPESAALAQLIGRMLAEGKVVAAVCHGPAGLVSTKDLDGQPIVAGRRVTGFTNSEEAGAGLTNVVPFLLEDRLKALGATFEAGPDWQPHVIRDGQLITGQNPQSSEPVAQAILAALAVTVGAEA